MHERWSMMVLGLLACGGAEMQARPCADGTMDENGQCVSRLACGAGTHAAGGVCVSDAEQCGAGTVLAGGACVPVPASGYDIRVAAQTFPADGRSKLPLFVIGTNMDGTPALTRVLLSVTPPSAGVVQPAAQTLALLGSTAYFIPCNGQATPTCVVPFRVQVALETDPQTPVATTQEIRLVPPAGAVGSPAPCVGLGNVIFFDGDGGDYIYPGTELITRGAWSASAMPAMQPNYVSIHVDPAGQEQGMWWDLDFSSRQLNAPLVAQIYENAERAAFASAGHPGIDIGGDGRGCNTITGRFQVQDITMDGSNLKSFTATFEQHCEGGSSALHGCVHIEQ